jgi:peptidoglycan/LPS O-acetylase OafA/YrhL
LQTPAKRIAFRPDIQGLRAVAVALVVLAHAGAPGFAGGFVGVDVFFVLSGYLITGLLVEERLATARRPRMSGRNAIRLAGVCKSNQAYTGVA